jgi:alpha-L-rhamnosidase
VVEILVHEAHEPKSSFLINTHFNAWTRFICREGENRFETFDFESYRWIQFVIRNHNRPIILKDIAVRRRIFPWPAQPAIACSDPMIEKLLIASINTLNNSAQDTVVDGMARERQQYSGDGAHQLHALYHAFNENRLPGRFVNTFSQGASPNGYFFDCWPAFDRVWRVLERNLSLSQWGPILDHNLGFAFDCYYYYQYTGQLEMLKEAYPRFAKMAAYFASIRDRDGLLKVENIGIPCVWMDHNAYAMQRHKQCSFNLYAAASFRHALAPLARAFGDQAAARSFDAFGLELETAAVRRFWDRDRQIFIANLPWSAEEGAIRTCDRSLATSILFDQCPAGETEAAIKMLTTCPKEMGLSYPANAVWRYWALAKSRAMNVVLDEFRSRWTMPSVEENNTIAEDWKPSYDSGSQWSHCAVAPLILLYHGIMGLRPTSPGYASFVIAPQLGDLKQIACLAHTVRGPIRFSARQAGSGHELTIETPPETQAELILDEQENVSLLASRQQAPSGCRSYCLPAGEKVTLRLK